MLGMKVVILNIMSKKYDKKLRQKVENNSRKLCHGES